MNQTVSTLIYLSFFVSSPVALASGHTPGSYTNYTFPGAPAGFSSVDYSILINKDPGWSANTFWSNQFSLIGTSGGYTGMQSNGGPVRFVPADLCHGGAEGRHLGE